MLNIYMASAAADEAPYLVYHLVKHTNRNNEVGTHVVLADKRLSGGLCDGAAAPN